MKKYIILLCCVPFIFTACKKGFLDKFPEDRVTDETYWTSENNVRTFAWGFYANYFSGYGNGSAWGNFFSGQSLNDDFAPTSPTPFRTKENIPAAATATYWNFTWVRKANLFLERIPTVPMDDVAKNHWTGIARFFRAMEYYDLTKTFGAVPWYDKAMLETDEDLYKPRDPLPFVVDKMLSDFQFAAENVRATDGTAGVTVNKFVVLAYMSRVFLYHGTYFKYHNIDQAKSKTYLEAAKWAADEVIKSQKYSIADNYRSLFNSLDLDGKKEIILQRRYEAGVIMHGLNSYNNKEPQTGASKNLIESYLTKDGLPVSLSPLYKGDKTIQNVMTDRDPRINETFVTQIRLNGAISNYSSSGYATHKFLNESIKDAPEGNGFLNTTDAPVMRYGEVLMNYAEAAAELGNLTQQDLDKSINVLRKRPGINMPNLQVLGSSPAVNGVIYDDSKRDQTVPSIIWEIRRERRIELVFEGFRLDDLKRWKRMEYTTTTASDINRGVWIKRSDFPTATGVIIENNASEGYVIPATRPELQRVFSDPRVYLEPIPKNQIQLYIDNDAELTQNPGW